MSTRSFFSFLKGTFVGGEVTSMLQLDFDKSSVDVESPEDISQLELDQSIQQTPLLEIKSDLSAQVPLIGIGGAGIRVLSNIVSRLAEYDLTYPALAIDTDKKNLDAYSNISHSFHIEGSNFGTAHQYRKAASRALFNAGQIQSAINEYTKELKMAYPHEVVFLILGSGGTGVGAGIETARILIEMGKHPVPFLILPARNEMTRIKFNAAVALYYFMYAPNDRCLNLSTIGIDNELFLNRNSKKHYSSVIAAVNDRISATIGDLVLSCVLESDAYSADINEFLEVFRNIKGMGFLQYLHIKSPGIGISDIYTKNFDNSVSLDVELGSATRGYIFLSTPEEKVTAVEYRRLMANFDNSDVFDKLYEISTSEKYYTFRGVFTGIPVPDYIEELMRLAEDSRIELLNKEIDKGNKGTSNHKIDQLTGDSEIDVKTDAEISKQRSESD